jgi:hypothetical protein
MAKPLLLNLAGTEFPLFLNKVERSDLYGYVEIETLDNKGRKCTIATLADDGKTLVAAGHAALAMLSPEGDWLEKKSLIPTDNQGKAIAPVASSYTAPVPLTATATIDDYLSHNIRAIYQISSDADLAPLMTELKKGTIFTFPYSFRGGLEPDVGFLLLAADGTPFLAIGCPTTLEFVGFEQTAGIAADEEESGEDEESLDFSMM